MVLWALLRAKHGIQAYIITIRYKHRRRRVRKSAKWYALYGTRCKIYTI